MSHDLLFNMSDQACARAWEDEGWGPYHKRLLTMCTKIEYPGTRKRNMETNVDIVLNHIKKAGSISMREAMDDYSMTGGSLAHAVYRLRHEHGLKVVTENKRHPITGRRYARYKLAA